MDFNEWLKYGVDRHASASPLASAMGSSELGADPRPSHPRLVRLMKGRSSRILRQEFPHLRRLPSLWTNSWFCATVGGAPIDVVRRYVENQKMAA